MPPSTRLVATLLFGSGMAALVYQTAWQRMFRLVFGASTGASAAVLAIFLGGLGLGGAWLGRRAERSNRPLLFYGNLEVGVALTAAATPVLVELAADAYFFVGGSRALGLGGATVVRLVLAMFVMGPSVVLMGGTLPAAARAAESDEDAARGRLAVLYSLNTAGAVGGSLLGTFLLFELFGTRLSLWIAVLVNLLVAVTARSIGRRTAVVPLALSAVEGAEADEAGSDPDESRGDRESPAPDGDGESASSSGDELGPPPSWLVYGAAGVFGFVFLHLELVWYRMLAPILGGSTFSFGLVLAVALAGIGLGGYVYTLRDRRRPATLTLLALTAGLEALLAGLPLHLGDDVALWAALLRDAPGLTFSGAVVGWVLVTALVVLPASIVSGYQFPVLFGLLGRGREGVARQVGLAYAFNTAGSIGGALLGGFVLIPVIGGVGSWRLVVGMLALVSAASLAAAFRIEALRERRSLFAAAAAMVLAIGTLVSEGPTHVWRHTPIGAGRTDVAGKSPNQLREWIHHMRNTVVWERDGIESAVALVDGAGYAFVVNGKTDGAVFGDRGTMVWSTLLPALIHEKPRSAFVIGLGLGMSAGWLAAVPGMKRVDVAELEPAIIEIAERSRAANFDVLHRANVHLFTGDGREFLLTTDRKYDIIMSEPSNPYRAGIASLFTKDYYEAVDAHLADRGVFAQWLQGYEVDVHTIRLVLRTLTDVFPYVEAWSTQVGDFLFIATREPRTIDVARLRERIADEPFRSALPRAWLVQDAEGVIAHYVARSDAVRAIIGDDVPVNTDDVNVLEYAFARAFSSANPDPVLDLVVASKQRGSARPTVRGTVDWERVEEERLRIWMLLERKLPAIPGLRPAVLQRAQAVANACHGQPERTLARWQAGGAPEPRDVVEAYALGLAYALDGDERSVELERQLEREGFTAEATLVRARRLAEGGRAKEAFDGAVRAIELLRSQALPLCDTAKQAIRLLSEIARRDSGLARVGARWLMQGPLASNQWDGLRTTTMQRLAFQSRDPRLCLEAMGDQLTLPWWSQWFLTGRLECLVANGHPLVSEAEDDLARYQRHLPRTFQERPPVPP